MNWQVITNKQEWESYKNSVYKERFYPNELEKASTFIPEIPCVVIEERLWDSRYWECELILTYLTRDDLKGFVDMARKMDAKEKINEAKGL